MALKAQLKAGLVRALLTLAAVIALAAPSGATPMYSITYLGPSDDPRANQQNLDPSWYDPISITNDGATRILGTIPSGAVGGNYQIQDPLHETTDPLSHYAWVIGTNPRQYIAQPDAADSRVRGVSSSGYAVGYSGSNSSPNFVYSIANQAFMSLNLSNLKITPAVPGPPACRSTITE
jgi:hypothetical protein